MRGKGRESHESHLSTSIIQVEEAYSKRVQEEEEKLLVVEDRNERINTRS